MKTEQQEGKQTPKIEFYDGPSFYCIEKNRAKSLCINKNCLKKDGMICDSQCSCKSQHEQCKFGNLLHVISTIKSKIYQTGNIGQYFQTLFYQLTDLISDNLNKIMQFIKKYKTCGLHELEKQFLSNPTQNFSSKKCSQLWDTISSRKDMDFNIQILKKESQILQDKIKKKLRKIEKTINSLTNNFNEQKQLEVLSEKRFYSGIYIMKNFYDDKRKNNFASINHCLVPLNMNQFVQYHWKYLKNGFFRNCSLTNIDWRIFTKHALSFQSLSQIDLSENNISKVQKEDFKDFRSLTLVNFGSGWDTDSLQRQSKMQLKLFSQSNQKIKIFYHGYEN